MASRDKQQMRRIVEDLRREYAIRRIKVSQASNDLVKFVTEHQRDDVLVNGFQNQKDNPFRSKSSFNCTVI